jgi:hypothetical protein
LRVDGVHPIRDPVNIGLHWRSRHGQNTRPTVQETALRYDESMT